MDTFKEFEILIRRKIPFVSNFLYVVMIFFFAFLFMLYVVMYPAMHSQSSNEMQIAYYILVVPDSLKILSSYSFIGLLIVVPLYYRARLHKQAILRFEKTNLLITGRSIKVTIPKNQIKKVYLNDLKTATGKPKERLQIIIQQHPYNKNTFRLKNYEEGGELIDALSKLDNVVFDGYDMEWIGNIEEDE